MAGTVGAEMEQQQTRYPLDPLMERNLTVRFAEAQIVERLPKCFNRHASACVPIREIFEESNPEAGQTFR
jgi:hypothetical protein